MSYLMILAFNVSVVLNPNIGMKIQGLVNSVQPTRTILKANRNVLHVQLWHQSGMGNNAWGVQLVQFLTL